MANDRMYLVNDRRKVRVYLGSYSPGKWTVKAGVEANLNRAFDDDDEAFSDYSGEEMSWRVAYEGDLRSCGYADVQADDPRAPEEEYL